MLTENLSNTASICAVAANNNQKIKVDAETLLDLVDEVLLNGSDEISTLMLKLVSTIEE